MIDDTKLSEVLREFARTLVTDFPIQSILDHLVGRIVDILPITSAGVTLISESLHPHYLAASDARALKFERLQSSTGEGPCLQAFGTGEAVAIADLRLDDRFSVFGPAAVGEGLVAVFALPLHHGAEKLGALDLYRSTPGLMSPEAMSVARTLADVASAYLLNARSREEARAASEEFLYRSLHDTLTGLPNRVLLEERMQHAARRASRSQKATAILFVDLDRFKHVNDSRGHHVGDGLLRCIATRLATVVRAGDTLARLSGDEFVFLCEDLSSVEDVDVLAARVYEAFIEPFDVAGTPISITASVGIALAWPGEDITHHLLLQADHAMYEVKRAGGKDIRIVDMRDATLLTDHTMESDLRAALAQDALDVAYQPIVDTTDGLVTGVEALLRWVDPKRGSVSPLTMVALAEQSDLIDEIGAWVLEKACRDRTAWLIDQPLKPLDVSVNVSPRQLRRPGYADSVAAIVKKTAMDPTALVLEMTEGVLIEESDKIAATLAELKRLGVRLALDDFGSGYSSLSYLSRLPIDIVKIDQTFIAEIDKPDGSTIVSAVTDLAHALRLTVIAEGVETEAQRAKLATIGCELSQGFYYARPMPASEISACLNASDGPAYLPEGAFRSRLDLAHV